MNYTDRDFVSDILDYNDHLVAIESDVINCVVGVTRVEEPALKATFKLNGVAYVAWGHDKNDALRSMIQRFDDRTVKQIIEKYGDE